MNTTADYLRDHRFQPLFTDFLGWDHAGHSLTVTVDGREFHLESVAHKRGLQVFCCSTNPFVVFNRGLLRKIQRAVARTVHEHILIFCCEDPRKQVWEWAIRLADGRRVRHREHPFFSASPPQRFVGRLAGLRFTLEEEESANLVEALARVRQALDTSADLNLFVKHPWYAERSAELAAAMRDGTVASFQAFVVFHFPLARKISRRYCGLFGLESEDAEQIAFLGLMRAARKYRPELGYQFSTYATYWIRQACQRFGPEAAWMIRIPGHLFWPCFRLHLSLERILTRAGPTGVREFLSQLDRHDPKKARALRHFERAIDVRSLSDRRQPEYRAARSLTGKQIDPKESAAAADRKEMVAKALTRLHKRQAELIRLRYGFDGPPLSLAEIGEIIQRTRERARQILSRAERRLQWILQPERKHIS